MENTGPPKKKSRFFGQNQARDEVETQTSNPKDSMNQQPTTSTSNETSHTASAVNLLSNNPATPSGITTSNARDTRRDGIYGVKSLLNKSQNAQVTQNGQPTSFIQASSAQPHQTVDIDRDHLGRRLPESQVRRILNLPPYSINNLPAQPLPPRVPIIHLVPENFHTSPFRVAQASSAAKHMLKRKRGQPVLPPPFYIYQRTNDPNFSIFSGFLLYPELCFTLATHLSTNSLLHLYSMSRDFHTIIDRRFTTVMLSQSLRKAPESSRIFTFRCYAHLCRNDPAARLPHPNPRKPNAVRQIPSIRWLRMVVHREKVVHEILAVFAELGVPLPARCSLALKRLWFILDIPDNARRVGFIHCKDLFSDMDLYFSMCFFVKLEMVLHDPVGVDKRDSLRKLLLGMPGGMTTVLKVLKREMWRNKIDVLQDWVRYRFQPRFPLPEDQGDTILGVPIAQAGKLQLEYWGRATEGQAKRRLQLLLRPEQLVMREAVRRGLRFTKHFLRCVLYGYIRPDTLEDYEPRKYGRRIDELKNEEYGIDDEVGGVGALYVQDGGDVLLDLGENRNAERSVYTVAVEEVSLEENQMREEQEKFLNKCMEWYQEESSDLEAMGSAWNIWSS